MAQRDTAMVALRRELTLYKWLLLFVIASWWIIEAIDAVLPGMTTHRGTVHRAVGGVLAQVITVPGFVPGAELGVDHHLRRLAERFGLGPDELPFRAASSEREIVR